jgi:hypothetical protein
MKSITLSIELANKLLGYLGSRPYGEVANLINAVDLELKAQIPPTSVVSGPVAVPEVVDEAAKVV